MIDQDRAVETVSKPEGCKAFLNICLFGCFHDHIKYSEKLRLPAPNKSLTIPTIFSSDT